MAKHKIDASSSGKNDFNRDIIPNYTFNPKINNKSLYPFLADPKKENKNNKIEKSNYSILKYPLISNQKTSN